MEKREQCVRDRIWKLHTEGGMSYTEIADAYGGLSRAAVAGIIHREKKKREKKIDALKQTE